MPSRPAPAPAPTPSERAWLAHLRLQAELPYPGWALMPGIAEVLQTRLPSDLVFCGWSDSRHHQPLALWAHPVDDGSFQRFMAGMDAYFREVSIEQMVASRGRIARQRELQPGYEQSLYYRDVYAPYGVHWSLQAVANFGPTGLGLLNFFRRREAGRYTDADQDLADRAAQALAALDTPHSPLADLGPAPLHEAAVASLLLQQGGTMLARSPAARDILFLARQTGMGPPEWARPDWHALPPAVVAAAQALFDQGEPGARHQLSQHHDWGRFDFLLERPAMLAPQLAPVVNVVLRHHESADITLARRLWGWPLKPQEKRLLIASLRQPTQQQLARVLGVTVATLKGYVNELLARLGVASRQGLIDRVLAGPPPTAGGHGPAPGCASR